MKNVLILCFLFVILNLPVYAVYSPIAPDCSNQYRKDINKVIKKQIPISKNDINNIFNEIESEQNSYVRLVMIDQGINSVLFEFYMELIDTTERYVSIKQDIPVTDWYGDLQIIVNPYLKDNNVNISELNKFLDYTMAKKSELGKKYQTI